LGTNNPVLFNNVYYRVFNCKIFIMNIDDKLLELVAKRVNLSKFDNDWLDKYFDIKYEINDYIEAMGYQKESIMLHLCLYLNIEAEEYIWAEQTKVEIHKLP
jgi:hypothetical protein